MAQIDVSSVRWTNDIDMRRFIDQYKHKLPQLLRTTSGYSDVNNINDIGQDEVGLSKNRLLSGGNVINMSS